MSKIGQYLMKLSLKYSRLFFSGHSVQYVNDTIINFVMFHMPGNKIDDMPTSVGSFMFMHFCGLLEG